MRCTPDALRQVLSYVAAYLSEDYGCTYGRLVEMLRETVPGLENLRYGDVYPILFNVTAAKTDQNDLCPEYDCDAVAQEMFKKYIK